MTPESNLYTENAMAGYNDGLAGKPAQVESEACKSGRFGYYYGYVQGSRRYREATAETEEQKEARAKSFFAVW